MRTLCITQVFLFLLICIFSFDSFGQNEAFLPKNELIPLEIPHFLKVDSLGEVEKWHIGNLQFQPSYLLKIYDRRGVLVFQSKKYENDWPTSQYAESRFLFVLEIEDKRINGWVEIER